MKLKEDILNLGSFWKHILPLLALVALSNHLVAGESAGE